ncbi:MAG: CinA family protein [Lachnospiraceae bacterium]|nr:CinA family protein [Lachnospiraceae bacterium]
MKCKKNVKMIGMDKEQGISFLKKLTAKNKEVSIHVTTFPCELHIELSTDEENKKELKNIFAEIKEKYKPYIFTTNSEEEIEDVLVNHLTKKGLTITTAESCTGGLLSGRIINASGASNVYKQGYITYSNKAKRKLIEVRKETLKKYGAVSKQTAKEMAKGAALVANADIALSVTGIAGPEGGTAEKPVGLVYIGCYYNGKTTVEEHKFTGNRREVREQSVASALSLLRKCLEMEG